MDDILLQRRYEEPPASPRDHRHPTERDRDRILHSAAFRRLQGKTQVPIDHAGPGEICAVAKLDELHPDAVLHDAAEDEHIHLAPLTVPTPVHGLAIAPGRPGDEQRLWDSLHRLVEEDPCLRLEQNPATHETLVYGLGELHLPVLIIVGAHDTPYMHAAADYMLERIPSARKAVIEASAHLPNMDRPEEFREIVQGFLGKQGD